MCHMENQLEQKSMIQSFYRRYVDDTLVTMPNTESATGFLQVLNNVPPSLSFIMELEHDGSIPFLGTVVTRCDGTLATEIYRKPTDTLRPATPFPKPRQQQIQVSCIVAF